LATAWDRASLHAPPIVCVLPLDPTRKCRGAGKTRIFDGLLDGHRCQGLPGGGVDLYRVVSSRRRQGALRPAARRHDSQGVPAPQGATSNCLSSWWPHIWALR